MLFFFNIMFVMIHVTDLPPCVCCLFISSLIHMNLSMDDGGRSAQQQWRSNVLAFTLRHRRWWFQPQLQEMLVKMGSSSPQVFGNEQLKEGIWSFISYMEKGKLQGHENPDISETQLHQLPFSQCMTMGEEMIKITINCNTSWQRSPRCSNEDARNAVPVSPIPNGVTVGWNPKVSPCFFAKKHGQNCQFPWGAMEPP